MWSLRIYEVGHLQGYYSSKNETILEGNAYLVQCRDKYIFMIIIFIIIIKISSESSALAQEVEFDTVAMLYLLLLLSTCQLIL